MNTTYYLNLIMGNVFNTKTDILLPTQYWLGLSTTAPNMSGGSVSEPIAIASGYNRVLLSTLSVPVNGVVVNDGPVSFNESLSSWGVIPYYTIYDSEVGGNLLMYGNLRIIRTVEEGTIITIKTGELVITLENPPVTP